MRVDVMSKMRGVAAFTQLWRRRTTLMLDGNTVELMSLPDLVTAKKTQRDKDWPMIRRLVDVNYLTHREEPTPERLIFWLKELRSPELLVEAAESHPATCEQLRGERPLLTLATLRDLESGELVQALRDEEEAERRRDAEYWRPLRAELERLRRGKPGAQGGS